MTIDADELERLREWVGQLPDTPCGQRLRARIDALLEKRP